MPHEFLAPLSDTMLEYYRDMADVMVELFDMPRAEAVARINERYTPADAEAPEHEIMGHELPEFWAYGLYYKPDAKGRLPTGDTDADADIDFTALERRPAPPKDSPTWTYASGTPYASGMTYASGNETPSATPPHLRAQ
ncbi:hypothetical protein GCM10010277_85510 [Streptomyces longisporoflavus]|uniref:hypothetical protein n=1 Tax=Streptomyces longisporoflavus TaxID=28044 RepID=UPI00167D4F1B|nr:hypothetical protein [Streptomyces longisporoflavus]GGV72515.1 hypothetical protein GCM10010277_85510 [Streptomyces longisporoflavus]